MPRIASAATSEVSGVPSWKKTSDRSFRRSVVPSSSHCHAVAMRASTRPSGVLDSQKSSLSRPTSTRPPVFGIPFAVSPMPMRIVEEIGETASRGAQPGVHTPAAMTTVRRISPLCVRPNTAVQHDYRPSRARPASFASVFCDRRLVDRPGASQHRLDLAVRLLDDRYFHRELRKHAVEGGKRRALLTVRRRLVDRPGASEHRLDLAVRLLDHRDLHEPLPLAKVIDHDVHEPGPEGAVLLGVLRLLVLRHLSLSFNRAVTR